MDSIPFSISDVYGGFAETFGIIRLDKDAVVLELQTQDSLLGVIKSDIKVRRLPFNEIETVTYKRGVFKPSIVIRARNLRTLENIPGADSGEVKIRFARKYREQAHRLAMDTAVHLSDEMLQRLYDDDIS